MTKTGKTLTIILLLGGVAYGSYYYYGYNQVSFVGYGTANGKEVITIEYRKKRIDIEKGKSASIGSLHISFDASGAVKVSKNGVLKHSFITSSANMGKRLN